MSVMVSGRQNGFGLIELLVGIVIGLIVMAGTIFVFIGNSESSLLHMRSTRVIQQVRDTMDRMVQDVRRSGYLGYRYLATADVAADQNFFSRYDPAGTLTTALSTQNCTDVSGRQICRGITYAYNLDDDGAVLVGTDRTRPRVGQGSGTPCDANNFDIDNVEMFGFRFREDTTRDEGWIEMRNMTTGDCTTAGVDADWVPVTDRRLTRIGDLGTGADDRVGFELLDQCVGFLDNVGPTVAEPDGDAYTDTNGDLALTCEDLEGVLDGPIGGVSDFEVRARQVRIQLRGWSKQDRAVTFKLTQVVDLPNHAARLVPAPSAP